MSDYSQNYNRIFRKWTGKRFEVPAYKEVSYQITELENGKYQFHRLLPSGKLDGRATPFEESSIRFIKNLKKV